MPFLTLALALAATVQPLDHREIKVEAMRPSRLLSSFSMSGRDGAFGLQTIRATADDTRGVIVVDGDAGELDTYEKYVSLFDVTPAKLTFRIRIVCVKERIDSAHTFTCENNMPFQFEDEARDLTGVISGRMNGDGTLTVYQSLPKAGKPSLYMFRTKSQSETVVAMSPSWKMLTAFTPDPSGKKPWEDPRNAENTYICCQVGTTGGDVDPGQRPPLP